MMTCVIPAEKLLFSLPVMAVDSLCSWWEAGTLPPIWFPKKLLSQPDICLGADLAFVHCINLRCCEVSGVGDAV